MAATGSDFVLDIMRYWADKDHGAALKIVEDASDAYEIRRLPRTRGRRGPKCLVCEG
jgi:hypothetical protein